MQRARPQRCRDDGRSQFSYLDEILVKCDAAGRIVSAGLRERRSDANWGWSNRSIASRLPAWVKVAQNREEVLHALARLRRRFAEPR